MQAQDFYDRTIKAGQPGQESLDRTARKDSQDCQDMTAGLLLGSGTRSLVRRSERNVALSALFFLVLFFFDSRALFCIFAQKQRKKRGRRPLLL
jgi:hypothetical protein